MKNIMLVVCLFATTACAQQSHSALENFEKERKTPALRQFQEQAQCTTEKALDLLGGDVLKQSVLFQAADACVPSPFTPEMGGLPANLQPSTRAERIASVSIAAGRRIKLCKDLGITGVSRNAECVKVFQLNDQP